MSRQWFHQLQCFAKLSIRFVQWSWWAKRRFGQWRWNGWKLLASFNGHSNYWKQYLNFQDFKIIVFLLLDCHLWNVPLKWHLPLDFMLTCLFFWWFFSICWMFISRTHPYGPILQILPHTFNEFIFFEIILLFFSDYYILNKHSLVSRETLKFWAWTLFFCWLSSYDLNSVNYLKNLRWDHDFRKYCHYLLFPLLAPNILNKLLLDS